MISELIGWPTKDNCHLSLRYFCMHQQYISGNYHYDLALPCWKWLRSCIQYPFNRKRTKFQNEVPQRLLSCRTLPTQLGHKNPCNSSEKQNVTCFLTLHILMDKLVTTLISLQQMTNKIHLNKTSENWRHQGYAEGIYKNNDIQNS